jgi:hypothetical protein
MRGTVRVTGEDPRNMIARSDTETHQALLAFRTHPGTCRL